MSRSIRLHDVIGRLATALLTLLLAFSSAAADAADPPGDGKPPAGQCAIYDFGVASRPPFWTVSIAHRAVDPGTGESQNDVLMVDAGSKRLRVYRPTAQGLINVGDDFDLPRLDGRFHPSRIQRVDDSGYLLELEDGRLVLLDRELGVVAGPFELLKLATSPAEQLLSVNDWVLVQTADGPTVVTFGDLRLSGTYYSGLVSVPLTSGGLTVLGDPVAIESGNRTLHHLGHQTLAVVGGERVYYLDFDGLGSNEAVVALSPSARTFESAFQLNGDVPSELGFKTPFNETLTHEGWSSARTLYGTLESASALPVALLSDGKSLFALSRGGESTENPGRTKWLISKLSASGSVEAWFSLELEAEHLVVSPGDGERPWYLLLKRAVERLGSQESSGLLTIPAEFLDGSQKIADGPAAQPVELCPTNEIVAYQRRP